MILWLGVGNLLRNNEIVVHHTAVKAVAELVGFFKKIDKDFPFDM